jgi:hypothetical protein
MAARPAARPVDQLPHLLRVGVCEDPPALEEPAGLAAERSGQSLRQMVRDHCGWIDLDQGQELEDDFEADLQVVRCSGHM